ncbi:putative fimbrial assembly protein PilE [Vibrio ichthyoenteri ATCC 700023]|uniref:Putative fimbrial assembly protein PilE n=2 Tax=Vibrio ichthyoenteri TaxID=142461 RepID=F9S2A5_9VIBR|nr:putative fimbrial assembly protein PilE [Vibrio ichthyoenteri ATCC 700023]
MTLIELLMVVVIISILVSFAYPSYQTQNIKAKRMVAIADLSRLQLYLENGYNNGYHSAKQAVISAATCLICQSSAHHYQFSVVLTSNGYLLTATPYNQQQNDPCLAGPDDTLRLNQAGVAEPASCWY